MRGTFDQWQKYAPVLDKDLNKLKSAYYEAKKPINDYIKKQESSVIAVKESLIAKVEAIDGDDGDFPADAHRIIHWNAAHRCRGNH